MLKGLHSFLNSNGDSVWSSYSQFLTAVKLLDIIAYHRPTLIYEERGVFYVPFRCAHESASRVSLASN